MDLSLAVQLHKRSQDELTPKQHIGPRLQSTTLKMALQKEKTKRLAKIINSKLDEISNSSLHREY